MARLEGFEPPTTWFVARYSIQLSYRRLIVEGVNYGEFGLVRQCVIQEKYKKMVGLLYSSY